MRVAELADVAEVHERMYGVQGVVASDPEVGWSSHDATCC